MFLRALSRAGVPVKLPPQVALLRLTGTIQAPSGAAGGAGQGSINLARFDRALRQSFGATPPASLRAVALVVNSPGGSPVQSSLIYRRVRQLQRRTNAKRAKDGLAPVPVLAFVEDVAASGGYYIAAAADEIVVDASSIVGSIGVIRQGFGFVEAAEKLGVSRRVTTSGASKSQLDPFLPEKDSDLRAVRRALEALHAEFRSAVQESRGDRLHVAKAAEAAAAVGGDGDGLFDGSYYTGREAVELGLADVVGTLAEECERRFGEEVQLRDFTPRSSPFGLGGGGEYGVAARSGGGATADALLGALAGRLGRGSDAAAEAAGADAAAAMIGRGLVDAAADKLQLEALHARVGGIGR